MVHYIMYFNCCNILGDITSSPDRVIEIIKAIGNTWPFLLTLTFIGFLILYRIKIGAFLSSFKKISGKTAIGEIVLENMVSEESKIEKSETQKLEPPKKEETIIGNEEKSTENENRGFVDVYYAVSSKKFDDAEKYFLSLQNAEKDSIKKEENELTFLRLKYIYGGINTVDKMKEKVNQTTLRHIKYLGYFFIGNCYRDGKNFDLAIENYEKSLENADKIDNKKDLTSNIAQCLYEMNGKENAVDYLELVIAENHNEGFKSNAYRELAKIYEKEKEWILKAVTLEMALSFDPNNKDLMFDVAYAFSNSYKSSNELMPTLSLLHYNDLINIDGKSAGGYNNLAVAYDVLKLQGMATKNYKKAVELDNSLASSNLANKYIRAGFYEEAKTLLNVAKNTENAHKNVWLSLSDLSQKETDEEERKANLLNRAKEEQKKIRKFGEDYFKRETVVLNLEGNWKYENEAIEFGKTPNLKYFEVKWSTNLYNFSVVFLAENRLSIVGEGNCSHKSGGISEKVIAFININTNSTSMKILIYVKEEFRSYVFEFTRE